MHTQTQFVQIKAGKKRHGGWRLDFNRRGGKKPRFDTKWQHQLPLHSQDLHPPPLPPHFSPQKLSKMNHANWHWHKLGRSQQEHPPTCQEETITLLHQVKISCFFLFFFASFCCFHVSDCFYFCFLLAGFTTSRHVYSSFVSLQRTTHTSTETKSQPTFRTCGEVVKFLLN